MAGVDLTSVQELLGHKSLNMTLRYAHLAPEHKTKAVKKLDGVLKNTEERLSCHCISYSLNVLSRFKEALREEAGLKGNLNKLKKVVAA